MIYDCVIQLSTDIGTVVIDLFESDASCFSTSFNKATSFKRRQYICEHQNGALYLRHPKYVVNL